MIGELARPGDKLIVKVAKENREWGYDPAPDGTEVTYVRPSEIDYGYGNGFGYEPGVYPNHCYLYVTLPDGKEICLGTFHLEFPDQDEYERRLAEHRKNRDDDWRKGKIRDLPETPFVDGDIITSPDIQFDTRSFPEGTAVIAGVDYYNIGRFCIDNVTPMPLYRITDHYGAGWHTMLRSYQEVAYQLVERGRPYKYRHGLPIEFKDVEDQARFLQSIGQTIEIRNPKHNLYTWTKDEAVEAVYSGLGHSITVGGGLFGSGPHTSVVRFKDEAVGEQVRQLTMKGFPRVDQLS